MAEEVELGLEELPEGGPLPEVVNLEEQGAVPSLTRQQRRARARNAAQDDEDRLARLALEDEEERRAAAGAVALALGPDEQAALATLSPAERERFHGIMREQRLVAQGKLKRPLSFTEFVDRVTARRFKWYQYALVLAGVLQMVADGVKDRVMIFAPPRHGKSESVSRLFPAYYLYRHAHRWVGLVSFGAQLASTLARAARGNFFHAKGERERGSVTQWETGRGGGMWSAGINGTQLGKGFHLGIVDDPLKNAEEAASERKRERHKDWWQSTFYSRREPRAAIVLIMQRWAEDDLAGWLLDQEWLEHQEQELTGNGAPEHWHIVNFEALKLSQEEIDAEERRDGRPAFPPTCTVEPDWRQPGEALCPERMDADELRRVRRRIGEFYWWALFQQRPRVREGTIFRVEWLKPVSEYNRLGARYVRWWDNAASGNPGADFTVGALLCRDVTGLYTIVDIVRGQWEAPERNRIIRATAEADVDLYGVENVTFWGEQEPGASGKAAAADFRRLLEGFNVYTEPTTGDKVTNATPLAAAAGGGNVQMLRKPWTGALRKEFADFPRGQHDDIVDACARAYSKLARRKAPPGAQTHTTRGLGGAVVQGIPTDVGGTGPLGRIPRYLEEHEPHGSDAEPPRPYPGRAAPGGIRAVDVGDCAERGARAAGDGAESPFLPRRALAGERGVGRAAPGDWGARRGRGLAGDPARLHDPERHPGNHRPAHQRRAGPGTPVEARAA